jgi:hypothetical protein
LASSRPSWKGYIKLALVSYPVALWPATAPGERVAFRQINRKTGNRIRHQSVDEATREPVEARDKGKGYRPPRPRDGARRGKSLRARERTATRRFNAAWLAQERVRSRARARQPS